MTKLILKLIGILALIYAVLTAVNRHSDYWPQRSFWLIQKDYKDMVPQMDSNPDGAVQSIAGRIDGFIQRYPQTALAGQAQLFKSNLFALQKDYDRAREEYGKIPEIYDKDQELLAEAEANMAKIYELQNQWPQALIEYEQVMTYYPVTATGLSVPIHIARYYRTRGRNALALDAYEKAVRFYHLQADIHPGSLADLKAVQLIDLCRFEEKNWERPDDLSQPVDAGHLDDFVDDPDNDDLQE